MVDIVVRSQKISREELRALVGGNERLMRLLENLTTDVTVTLPEAIETGDLGPVYEAIGVVEDSVEALALRVDLMEAVCLALDRRLSGMDALRVRLDDVEKLTIGA